MTKTLESTLIVHDLGVDSEAWLVEGTLNVWEAKNAVKAWIIECMGDEDSVQYVHEVDQAKAIIKKNWFWEPLADGSIEDDMLTSLDDKPNSEGVQVFAGVHLR